MGHFETDLGHSEGDPLLNIALVRDGSVAIHDQIREHLQYLINTGALRPGAALPSVRQLSDQLATARATVQRAYSDLQALGLLESRHGAGTFVVDFQQAAETIETSADIAAIVENAIEAAVAKDIDLMRLEQAFHQAVRQRRRSPGSIGICYVDEFDFGASNAALLQEGVRDLSASVEPIDWRHYRTGETERIRATLTESDLIVCAPYVFSEVRTALPGRAPDIEGITFHLHPDVALALSALDPSTNVGVIATRPEYLSWTLAVVNSRVVLTAPPKAASLEDAEAIDRMRFEVDLVIFGTGARDRVTELFGDAEKIELRHVPAPGSLHRIRELIAHRQALLQRG